MAAGRAFSPKPFFSGVFNQMRRARNPRIDEHPVPVAAPRRSEKDDINHGQSLIGEIGCDFVSVIMANLIGFRIIGAQRGVQSDLVRQGFLLRKKRPRKQTGLHALLRETPPDRFL